MERPERRKIKAYIPCKTSRAGVLRLRASGLLWGVINSTASLVLVMEGHVIQFTYTVTFTQAEAGKQK